MSKQALDLLMQLSDDFTLGEFLNSQTADRHGVRNEPSWEHVIAMRNLCQQVLQPLRNHFGPIHINSGYRCERLNELVHGVGNSQHMRGEAADIYIPNLGTGLQYFDFIRDNTIFDQLLFEYNSRGGKWLHVSCKMDKKHNRYMAIPNYTLGLQ